MKKLPPPTVGTILLAAGGPPVVMFAFVQLAKAGAIPTVAITPVTVALAGVSTLMFAAAALWWLIANPSLKPCNAQTALRILRKGE